jgi:cell filamentation protein
MPSYRYSYGKDEVYCYPGSNVLINKLNLKDKDAFFVAERVLTSARLIDARGNHPIKGSFDLTHLQKIHQYLFQDIYSWAGEIRKIDISKGQMFCRPEFIVEVSQRLFDELEKEDFLGSTPRELVYLRLSYYLAGINAIHPFREGNGRAQRLFIEYLAQRRGFSLDFSSVTDQEMIAASYESFYGKMGKMDAIFKRIIKSL